MVAERCDVTNEADVEALVARCVDEFGRIDVMINNAGITRDSSMAKMSLDDFRAVIDVHLQGAWLGTKAAGARMREQGGGAIVNLSSISGKVGNFGQTNYSAAKAGIVGLTKAAAKELAPQECPRQRRAAGLDPYRDDRGDAAGRLGLQDGRDPDGPGR